MSPALFNLLGDQRLRRGWRLTCVFLEFQNSKILADRGSGCCLRTGVRR